MKNLKIVSQLLVHLVLLTTFFYSCEDKLSEDTPLPTVLTNKGTITATSQTEVWINVLDRTGFPASSDINIGLEPQQGSVSELDSLGWYLYHPNNSFLEGADFLTFEVVAGQRIMIDSVQIEYSRISTTPTYTSEIVIDCQYLESFDRTHEPWPTWPIYLDDRVSAHTIKVSIDLSKCPDLSISSLRKLPIEYGPSYGHFFIEGLTVTYTPETFIAKDYFPVNLFYNDDGEEKYIRLHFRFFEKQCTPTTWPDTTLVRMFQYYSEYGYGFSPFSNVTLCNSPDPLETSYEGVELSIVEEPVHGKAIANSRSINYTLYDDSYRGMDSLIYGIRYNGSFYQETFYILIKQCGSPSTIADDYDLNDAIPDSDLPDGATIDDLVYYFDVFSNDDMCDLTFLSLKIKSQPTSGFAEIENNLLKYTRDPNFVGVVNFQYHLLGSHAPEMPWWRYGSSGDVGITITD